MLCNMNDDTRLTTIRKPHPDYPPLLRHIKRPPEQLRITGTLANPTNKRCISIVGTRRTSRYGITQTKKIIEELRDLPIIIVSGLADGIDSIAHETALANNITTWAVLGHGHAQLPTHKQKIAQRIIEQNGCIISEYAPEIEAQKFTFPERNRIIAGISQLTLVTEAPLRSGANITARIAREENRDVFALTADLDRTTTEGNLMLIEQNIAETCTSSNVLRLALGYEPPTQQSKTTRPLPPHLDIAPVHQLLKLLSPSKPTTFDALMEATKTTTSRLLELIALLELDDRLNHIPGGYISTR